MNKEDNGFNLFIDLRFTMAEKYKDVVGFYDMDHDTIKKPCFEWLCKNIGNRGYGWDYKLVGTQPVTYLSGNPHNATVSQFTHLDINFDNEKDFMLFKLVWS